MSLSAISSAGFHTANQQGVQSLAAHKHGGRHSHSLADIDAMSSSVASSASSTGKTGSKVDIRA
jgi:hypothetical protein